MQTTWRVTNGDAIIQRYGIEAASEIARILWDAEDEGRLGELRNRGGYAHVAIRDLAAILQQPLTDRSIVDRYRLLRAVGGRS